MIKIFGLVIIWYSTYKENLYRSQVVGYRKAMRDQESNVELKLDEELIGKKKCLTQ